MTYAQTLNYLFTRLPMYQRIGAAAYKANLDNTIALCRLLGNPENKFKSVHIAGTNGKGSVSHMLASVLQSSGLKVGLYTSPHLKDFRERIRINGKMISEKEVVDFVGKHKKVFEKINPSFFEMTVALAFNYFAEQKVDIAVIEVGLGGRLDSTNVLTPLLSVITNISYDHTNLLGNTLKKIAGEKAGIIKPGGIAVIGEKQKETNTVFIDKAKEQQALLCFAGDIFYSENASVLTSKSGQTLSLDVHGTFTNKIFYKNLKCELPGMYQQKNIVTVLAGLALMEKLCGFNITNSAILKGFANVVKNTGLLGRWQILSQNPLTIADTGHNEAGIKEVLKQIKLIPHKNLHFVFGTVNDKDIDKILALLPKKAQYYFCKANIDRALDETILFEKAKKFKLKGTAFRSVKAAVKAAKSNSEKNDLVFVGGSTFVVAEVV